ncbi:MAG: hypothetical protein R2836_10505 [Chitinophagales bacterium]
MKTLKNYFLFAFLGLAIALSSCKKEDEIQDIEPLTLECNSFEQGNPNAITLLKDRGTGVDYIINCIASVEVDLVIEPGVKIAFTNDAGLQIEDVGSLSAVATESSIIEFTGLDKVKGSWNGILFYSNDVKNRMEHCLIDYAGGGTFNSNGDLGSLLLWADCYLRLSSVTISNGAAYGINADYDNINFAMEYCTITTCNFPFIGDAVLAKNFTAGSYLGNSTNAIVLTNHTTITGVHVWADLGVPYRIRQEIYEDLYVENGSLTIEPGVTVEFESGTGIYVGDTDESSLIAVGTEANPILFTGVTKTPGSWGSISFNFTLYPNNEIAYAIFEYAGADEGAIYMWAEPVVNIHDVEFRNISSCALYAAPGVSNPNTNLTYSNLTTTNVAGGLICGE